MLTQYTYKTLSCRVVCVLLLCLFYCHSQARAEVAQNSFAYEQPKLFTRAGKLWVSLPLSVTSEDDLSALLRERSTLELRIDTLVQKKRTLWLNKDLAEQTFTSIMRHDPLSREFKLTHPVSGQVASDPLLRRLLANTWKKLELPLADATLFEPGEDYLVEIEISLKHTELPSWLERTLVFWNKDVVNSEHIALDYKVENAPVSR